MKTYILIFIATLTIATLQAQTGSKEWKQKCIISGNY